MKRWITVCAMLLASTFARESISGQCVGEFANPITDICWSCMFPMSIGGNTILTNDQEDTSDNPSDFFCYCNNPVRVGIGIGFWEPARRVDVTRTPYCFVSLGGISLNPGIRAPEGEVRQQADLTKQSNYQAHWYADPILYYLEIVLDNPCLETGSFDVGYITEVDPTWNDDELTMILNPETFLFGNPLAQAACAGDCVLASSGFGSDSLFWCAGCNGSIYPFNGHVQAHVSAVQASSLVAQRMAAKMHREMVTWGTAGSDAMCGVFLQPVMRKDQYKYHMLYPIPQTKKINGRCCQPFGRTTAVWGAGKSYPYKGEDFSYQIFRKRNCCAADGALP